MVDLFLAAPVTAAMTLATVCSLPLESNLALGGKSTYFALRHVLFLYSGSNGSTIYSQRSLYPRVGRAITTVMLVQGFWLYRSICGWVLWLGLWVTESRNRGRTTCQSVGKGLQGHWYSLAASH
jgi:hypothetical protein